MISPADPGDHLRQWLAKHRVLGAERAQLPRGNRCASDSALSTDVGLYTPAEMELLRGAPAAVCDMADTLKQLFADSGGSTVIDVHDDPTWRRREAARLIRQARDRGHHRQAVALRDCWRERVAICTVTGGLAVPAAERIAADELADV